VVMCRVLRVHRSGYYAWLRRPVCARALEDRRLLDLVRASYQASGGAYGSPRIFLDLREDGERCGRHRVVRLITQPTTQVVHSYFATSGQDYFAVDKECGIGG
jgi:putative transposase